MSEILLVKDQIIHGPVIKEKSCRKKKKDSLGEREREILLGHKEA